MTAIIVWYLLFLVLSFSFWPLGKILFANFIDFGYPLYRIMALLLSSLLTWIFVATQLVDFSRGTCWLVIGILMGINFLILFWKKITFNRNFIKKAFLYELLFLLFFSLFTFYRSYNSELNDIEKPMDMGLLMSIIVGEKIPPNDPWLAEKPVSYYYFGHATTAMLTKLTNIPAETTFNLMVVSVYTLYTLTIFSLVFNLTNSYFWSIVGIILSSFSGNLAHLFSFFGSYGDAFFWWATPTRIIPYTINEFPLYSFLLGDLHAHYLDLPFTLLAIGLIFSFFQKPSLLKTIILGLDLAAIFMTNSWDYLIYLPLFFLVAFVTAPQKISMLKSLRPALTTLLVSLPFIWFFLSSFENGSEGFKLVTIEKTKIEQFFILYAPHLLTISFFIIIKQGITAKRLALYLALQALSIWIAIFLNLAIWPIILFFFLALGLLIFKKSVLSLTTDNRSTTFFVLLIALTSLAIILFCEFFYLKDIYSWQWQRANTVFKFHYQFWLLSCLWIPFFAQKISQKRSFIGSKIFLILFFFVLAVNSTYIYWGVKQSIEDFSKKPTLNGIKFLENHSPMEYLAVKWIRKNIKEQKIIAQKPGQSYTQDSFISTFTGQLTPIGWLDHEYGWRGNKKLASLMERKTDLENLYQTQDPLTAREIIKKYQIDYIYLGNQEKSAYKFDSTSAIYGLGKLVFSQEPIEIIKVEN